MLAFHKDFLLHAQDTLCTHHYNFLWFMAFISFASSHREVFYKPAYHCIGTDSPSLSDGVLQKYLFQNAFLRFCLRWAQTVSTVFLKTVCRREPATLLKNRPWHRCFPANFAKFLKMPFLTGHPRWLLLKMLNRKMISWICGHILNPNVPGRGQIDPPVVFRKTYLLKRGRNPGLLWLLILS